MEAIDLPIVNPNIARKHPLARCESCTLCRAKFVPSTIVPDGEVVVIGEAPGADEANKGAPFIGMSGQIMRRVLRIAGLNPETSASFMNVVACRPPMNREPSPDEVEACRPRLEDDLAKAGGNIIAVGLTASEAVSPTGLNVGKKRGLWTKYRGRDVMTTWHPAYVLRKPSEMETLQSDVERALLGPSSTLHIEPNIRYIRSVAQLREVVDYLRDHAQVIAFDIETDQLQWFNSVERERDPILMFAMAWSGEDAAIVTDNLLYDEPEARTILDEMFAWKHVKFVGHNAKFDCVFVRSHTGVQARVDYDSMLAHYALNEQPGMHGLKMLAKTYFGMEDYEQDLVKAYLRSVNDKYSKVPFEHLSKYAAIDVCVTFLLWEKLEGMLKKRGLWEWPFVNLFMPINEMFTQMELEGMHVDVPHLEKLRDDLEAELDALVAEIRGYAGNDDLNINSPMQLAKVLYDQLQLPDPMIKMIGKGVKPRCTNKEALAKLEGKHPIVDAIQKHRRVSKMLSSYVLNLMSRVTTDGRVHAQFYLHGTETGRISVRDPALQTIPRESKDAWGARIRQSFVAPEGHVLVIADYSQAELRAFAALSGEPFLIDVYAHNRDLHSEVAKAMFGDGFTKEQRNLCKMFNFAYVYGGTEYSMLQSNDRGQLNLAMAREFVRKYDQNMPRAAAWKREMVEIARKQGWVGSRTGRRRRFQVINQMDKNAWEEVRKASMNMPVQGLASDLTLISCMRIREAGIRAVMVVHDSVICEVPKEKAEWAAETVARIMKEVGEQWCPEVTWKADGDIASRWGAKD